MQPDLIQPREEHELRDRNLGRRMVFLVGAGGHGKVVLDALVKSGYDSRYIVVSDNEPSYDGREFFGLKVKAPAIQTGVEGSFFHVALGESSARQQIYRTLQRLGGAPMSIVHPAAVVSPFASIGAGTFVAATAVIAPHARIGEGVIVNHGAVVDHDCVVESFSHIAPNATLCGHVRLGAMALVGAGSTILPGVRVGDGATIGAGGVVLQDIGAGITCVGVPARPFDRS